MSVFDSMIDPTDFGTVARYLRTRLGPIDYILHVKEQAMLAPLAEELDQAITMGSVGPREVPRVMQQVQEGSLLISSRALLEIDARFVVEPSTIPASAYCNVLYLPPFYLVHTPGLFEGTLIREAPANHHRAGTRPEQSKGIKL